MKQVALPRRRWAARHRESQQHEVSAWKEQDRFRGSQPIGWNRIGWRLARVSMEVSEENGQRRPRRTGDRMDRLVTFSNNQVNRSEAQEGSSTLGYGVSRSSPSFAKSSTPPNYG